MIIKHFTTLRCNKTRTLNLTFHYISKLYTPRVTKKTLSLHPETALAGIIFFNNMDKVSENPFKNRAVADMPLIVVTALFVTCYLVSNLMAVKVIGLFNLFYFDAGTITFPFAYMLGDVLTEIWGYKTTRKIIFLTFLCNVFMVICTQIGVWLPSPDYLDGAAESYNTLQSILYA